VSSGLVDGKGGHYRKQGKRFKRAGNAPGGKEDVQEEENLSEKIKRVSQYDQGGRKTNR